MNLTRFGRSRLAVVALLRAALVLSFLAFFLSIVLRAHVGTNLLYDAVLYNVPFAAAAAICLLRQDSERLPWRLVGAGLALFTAANVYSTLTDPPYPSIADAGWLLFYPLVYAMLITLVRQRVSRFSNSTWLDGAIAGLGGGALAAAFTLGPIIENTSGSLATVLTNLAYPVGDLLLLAFVLAIAAVSGRGFDRGLTLLAAGFTVFAVTDTIFLFEAAKGTYVEGGIVDLGWPAAATLIGIAASLTDRQRRAPDGTSLVALPAVFSLCAIVVLAARSLTDVPYPATIAALTTLVLGVTRVALAFHDLRSLADARSEARTDELTGLGNRRRFFEWSALVLGDRAPDRPLSVLLVDLDGFKLVNDTLGHHVGDELLRRVGPRIGSTLRPNELVARLGGDEFVVVVDGDQQSADVVARRVQARISQPYELDGQRLYLDASVGIAVWPQDGVTPDELLRCADIAMYAGKRAQHRVVRFNPSLDGTSGATLRLIADLHEGLDRGEVLPYYQPVVRADDGRVVAAEALVRWHHPRDGVLSPAIILPVAAAAGLRRRLTERMFAVALADCARWRAEGHELGVYVNVDAADLADPNLTALVATALARAQVAPDVLTIEITDPRFGADADVAIENLAGLRTLGVRVALDDFGAEEISPGHLQTIPVDVVKLAGSLAGSAHTDRTARAIVAGLVDTASRLGLATVAEGIEDREAAHALTALGCDYLQGFEFTRPLPRDAFAAWLATSDRYAGEMLRSQ